jgi:hypothetical protein
MSKVLEWEISVPLFSNSYLLSDILVVLFVSVTAVACLMLIVTKVENFYIFLKSLLLGSGVFVVFLVGVMDLVYVSMFEIRFRIEDDGVFSCVSEFTSNQNRLAWIISAFSQNLSLTGSSMLTIGQESVQVPWSSVNKVVIDEAKRVIMLSATKRPLMRLYCLSENIHEAVVLVENYLPEADFQYR